MKSTIFIFRNGKRVNTITNQNEQAKNDLLQLYKHYWQYKEKQLTNYKKVSITSLNNIINGKVEMYCDYERKILYVYDYIIEE